MNFFYEPAMIAVPRLRKWLENLDEVQHEHLRRLILVILRDTYHAASYYDYEFTTQPNKKLSGKYFLPIRLLFHLYNVLSPRPIENNDDYEEEVGGLTPPQIDLATHFCDFVMGDQWSKMILETEKLRYKKGESVSISLTIQNLKKTVLLYPKNQATVKFVMKSTPSAPVEEIVGLDRNIDNLKQGTLLEPYEKKLIKWFPTIINEGHHWVTVELYSPHYEKVIELNIEFWYDEQPSYIAFSNRDLLVL